MSTQLTLTWLDAAGLRRAQQHVTTYHYLRRPVDTRCCPQGYSVEVAGKTAGFLLFGRPQATVCRPWYGGLADLATGRVAVSRWQVLNLARVWFLDQYQAGGRFCTPELLPGYIDRGGQWRSTLASTAIGQACERIGLDYLLTRPPCFLDEPYALSWVLSYCSEWLHRGVVYQAAGFERWRAVRTPRGIMSTYRKPLRPLTADEDRLVRQRSARDPRAASFRRARRVAEGPQVVLLLAVG